MAEHPMIEIASNALSASINPFGAELSHLRDAKGRELMTDADPAFWTGRAPLLFPIVGALAGGRYRLDGREYPLPQHGFARRQMFETVAQGPGRAVLQLADNEATRAVYPFAFALDVAFALEDARLSIEATVTNRDRRAMPASFGYHPALAWPLPFGAARADHSVWFETDEAEPIRRLGEQGLLAAEPHASPLDGTRLALDDALFAHGALIWDTIASRSLAYGAETGPRLRLDFDAPMLGIWTKPGAHFVCIEPWWGVADPEGFVGEIWDKPGMMRIEPGEARTFAMQVTLVA